MSTLEYIIIIAICVLLLYIYCKFFKTYKTPCVGLITGSPKTGKSTLAVYLAVRDYKNSLRAWKRQCFFIRLKNKFKNDKQELPEKPVLYSNIPLNTDFVPLTKDFLTRRKRCPVGSVAYIGEISLVASSQDYKDDKLNQQLLLFFKLIGHEGCRLYVDTQSIHDVHYSLERCVSEQLYIHRTVSKFLFIPLPFLLMYVQECRYSADKSVIQVNDGDVEDKLKVLLVPRRVWNLFDYRCYSALTDDLPLEKDEIATTNLKTGNIVSFVKYDEINIYNAKIKLLERRKKENEETDNKQSV